jgi:hypothetical protein
LNQITYWSVGDVDLERGVIQVYKLGIVGEFRESREALKRSSFGEDSVVLNYAISLMRASKMVFRKDGVSATSSETI